MVEWIDGPEWTPKAVDEWILAKVVSGLLRNARDLDERPPLCVIGDLGLAIAEVHELCHERAARLREADDDLRYRGHDSWVATAVLKLNRARPEAQLGT